MKTYLTISILFFFTSCSNYVNNIHKQIDREERGNRPAPAAPAAKTMSDDEYVQQYKNKFNKVYDKKPVQNPRTFSLSDGGPSGQVRAARKERYQADDFVDNDGSGSLWAGQGSSASLFTYQNDKRPGDMIIINVLENLRNQISSELKRLFPDKPKKSSAAEVAKAADTSSSSQAASNQQLDQEMDMKVYDKISGVVTEEISRDYILLRGKKDVIFKKEKKSIEVQALVSRKDIMENDYVNSDKLLDSRVIILR